MWWKEAKIYELYIDKFAQDISGLIAKLDYFTELGVNTLHILPHYPSPMVDDGYDITDYRAVRGELGTLAAPKRLPNGARRKKMGVIAGFVLRLSGRPHPGFVGARPGTANPKRGHAVRTKTAAELAPPQRR